MLQGRNPLCIVAQKLQLTDLKYTFVLVPGTGAFKPGLQPVDSWLCWQAEFEELDVLYPLQAAVRKVEAVEGGLATVTSTFGDSLWCTAGFYFRCLLKLLM